MTEKKKRYDYKVTLKSGDFSSFPNDNNYENYEERLVSGIYSISTANGGTLPISRESVLRIEKIEKIEKKD